MALKFSQKSTVAAAQGFEPQSEEPKSSVLPIRRSGKTGRPASGKIIVTLRLSPEVVTKFKATGKGWQAKIDEALKKAVPYV